MVICKVCGKEGSEYNIFDEFLPLLNCHERCLEKGIEMGIINMEELF